MRIFKCSYLSTNRFKTQVFQLRNKLFIFLLSFSDFLGRTEIRVKEILHESKEKRGPITKRLLLHEISSGEVVVKLDLQLYDNLGSNE